MAAAVAALVLAVVPGDGLGAQRIQAAMPEYAASYSSVIQSIGSDDERSLLQASTSPTEDELQLVQLGDRKPDLWDHHRLGRDAWSAISQWPAAQKVDPEWEWERILIFFVQSALIVQGHDPGKPDGLMGPKTMLALIAWSAMGGPPWDGNSERSYIWGLDDNVAYLLHGTLKTMGLSPGPLKQFLGNSSVLVLDRWDGTFRRSAMFNKISEEAGRQTVMYEFGPARSEDAEGSGNQSGGEVPPFGSPGAKGVAAGAQDKPREMDAQNRRQVDSPWGKPARKCISVKREGRSDGHRIEEYEYSLENNCGTAVILRYCLNPPLPTGPGFTPYVLTHLRCGPEGHEERERGDEPDPEPYCSKWVILNSRQYITVGREAEAYRKAVPIHPIEGTIVDRCNYYASIRFVEPGDRTNILFSISPRSRKPKIIIAACLGLGQKVDDPEVSVIVSQDGKFRCLKAPLTANYGAEWKEILRVGEPR